MSDIIKDQEVQDDLHGSFLTFYIDDAIYGVELFNVTEIIGEQAVTWVPHSPDYIIGIINLRGKIVPLIDVRTKFNLPKRDFQRDSSIVVINHIDEKLGDVQIGIVVDRVRDVCSAKVGELVDLPEMQTEAKKYLKSVLRIGESLVLMLKLDAFLQEEKVAK